MSADITQSHKISALDFFLLNYSRNERRHKNYFLLNVLLWMISVADQFISHFLFLLFWLVHTNLCLCASACACTTLPCVAECCVTIPAWDHCEVWLLLLLLLYLLQDPSPPFSPTVLKVNTKTKVVSVLFACFHSQPFSDEQTIESVCVSAFLFCQE